jgi:uncharacterized protein (TIGR00730 family)
LKEKSRPNRPFDDVRGDGAPGEKFDAWNPGVLAKIDGLLDLASLPGDDPLDRGLAREMIISALKARHSKLDTGDLKILSRSLRELRYGFRVFKPYRNRRKVTVFGSARTPASHPEYRQARDFARRIAAAGYMVITGAGPGIMQAGNEGAGPDNSFGVGIRLPFETEANKFIARNSLFIDCRFFFTRKLMFLKETSAVVCFPGGFGTHDEGMETLTLIQTGKADPIPVVFIDPPGSRYWSDWVRYVDRQLVRRGMVAPADMALFKHTHSAEEAVKEIAGFYRNYHSMRYVRENLVVRLQRHPPAGALKAINKDFRDLCATGGFHLSGPLPEETEHLGLQRLTFQFKRRGFGRLRLLIDRLNAY